MSSHKEIVMCLIPSHIGVRGNKRVDSVVKVALDLKPDNIRIPYTDLKPKINKLFFAKWQQRWNNNINNKLFQIKPTLGEWRPAFRKSRKEQVIISRLRVSLKKKLTHSFVSGDLGINNKTPNRMLTRRLSHTKCINASLRIGSTHSSGQKSKRK